MGWYRLDVAGSRLAFTDRRGGSSGPPYTSLDLSTDQGDDLSAVAANREAAGRFIGVPPERWVPIRQVHGTATVFDDAVRDEAEADAVVVTRQDRAGLVLTADCAPLALVARGAVVAVHGGWRGLLDGVVGSAVEAVTRVGGTPHLAVLGPCIHPCCYEFGEDDLTLLTDRFGAGVAGSTTTGAAALDVPAVVRSAVEEAGIARLVEVPVCTACSPDYFSHRRDTPAHGTAGRQGLLVTRTS